MIFIYVYLMDDLISESHVAPDLSTCGKWRNLQLEIFIMFLSGALLWNVFEKLRHVTWPFQYPCRLAPGIA